MSVSSPLPQYQCHKKVWALKIIAVEQSAPDAVSVPPGGTWVLQVDGKFAPVTVSHEWYTKHRPVAGGYFVVYPDGYKSFSPADAFEDGYTRIGSGGATMGTGS